MPYPLYDDENRNWTSDQFSFSNAIANGSKYLENWESSILG